MSGKFKQEKGMRKFALAIYFLLFAGNITIFSCLSANDDIHVPPSGFILQDSKIVLRYGDIVRLEHQEKGSAALYLSTHAKKYYHSGSSKQQQVFVLGIAKSYTPSWWVVKPQDGADLEKYRGMPVTKAAMIRLEDVETGACLHSHPNKPAPQTSELQEVTGCEHEDSGDNWVIANASGDNEILQGDVIQLRHRDTSKYLRSQPKIYFDTDPVASKAAGALFGLVFIRQEVAACPYKYGAGPNDSAEKKYRSWGIAAVARSQETIEKVKEIDNAPPEGFLKQDDDVVIRYGDAVQIMHEASSGEEGIYLYSHKKNYTHSGSSKQQQVMGEYITKGKRSSWWIILGAHGTDEDALLGKVVDLSKPIRLEHVSSQAYLHSSSGKPAPKTRDLQEVAAFVGKNVASNWEIFLEQGDKLKQGMSFLLKHKETGKYLRLKKDIYFDPFSDEDSGVFSWLRMRPEVAACDVNYGAGADNKEEKGNRSWSFSEVFRSAKAIEKAAKEKERESEEKKIAAQQEEESSEDDKKDDKDAIDKRYGIPEGYILKILDKGNVPVAYGDCIRIVHADSNAYLNAYAKPYPQDNESSIEFQVYGFVTEEKEGLIVKDASWWRIMPADNDKEKLGKQVENNADSIFEVAFKEKVGCLYSDPVSTKRSPKTAQQRVSVVSKKDALSKKWSPDNFIWQVRTKNNESKLIKGSTLWIFHEKTSRSNYLGTKKSALYDMGGAREGQEIFIHSLRYEWTIKEIAAATVEELQRLKDRAEEESEEKKSIAVDQNKEKEEVAEEIIEEPVAEQKEEDDVGDEEVEKSQEQKIPLNLPLGFNKIAAPAMISVSVGSTDGRYAVWAVGKNDQDLYVFEGGNFSSGLQKVKTKAALPKGSLASAKPVELFSDISVSSMGQVYAVSEGKVFMCSVEKNSFGSIEGVIATEIPVPSGSDILFDQVSVGMKKKVQLKPGVEAIQDVVWARTQDDELYELVNGDWVSRTEKNVAIDIAVGLDGTVLALNQENVLFSYVDETWTEISLNIDLAMVGIGKKEYVYGVTTGGEVVKIDLVQKVATTLKGANSKVATGFQDIAVNAAGSVVAFDYQGIMYGNDEKAVSVGQAAEVVAEVEKEKQEDKSNKAMQSQSEVQEKEDNKIVTTNDEQKVESDRNVRFVTTEKSVMYDRARSDRRSTLMSARGRTSRQRAAPLARRPSFGQTRISIDRYKRGVNSPRSANRSNYYSSAPSRQLRRTDQYNSQRAGGNRWSQRRGREGYTALGRRK